MPNLYDQDFHAWANQQAAFLRAGRLSGAEIANIAEEIESIGRGEKRDLDELKDHLGDNPSLKAMLPVAVETACRRAPRLASIETGLPEVAFPAASPWTFDEAMEGEPRA